ncbi:cercosporin resistance [Fusarium agapanthi]|uniref:Cercosporin resistance n=1 Tax=Fusarium agapanthi TaxID=1803897 RepID=A0A9P5EBV7_9HYPO|nr:cercosporin resistance [Fusarium agapanthi]
MRFYVIVAALCAPSALSFPWLGPEGLDALLNHPEARAEIDRRLKEHPVSKEEKSNEPRQLKTGIAGRVVSLLGGTVEAAIDNVLGLIPTNKAVKGLQKFPEVSHPFKAPGKTDQRGPCPSLNTLANHGYILRNGIATIGQIQAGTAKLFNMGADLSALLAVGGAVDGGDILSQKMSIGGPDNRVGLLNGALNKIFGKPSGIAGHYFYLNGDNISFKSELFKQMHQQALAKGDGTYNVDAIKEHFKNRYRNSKAANKQFYFNIPSAAPKRKNAWKDKDLEYTHAPERIPEQGWYRRATPMTIPEAVGGILDVYLYAQPALGGSGAGGSWVVGPLDLPKDPQGLSCFLYNAIYANFPAELFNSVRLLQSILNGVSDALVPGYKALGCKVDFPDAKGSSASKKFAAYEKKYVGPAKTKSRKSPTSSSRTRLLEQRLSRVLALLGNQAQGTPMSGFVAQLAAEDLNMNVLNGNSSGQLPLSLGLTLQGTLDIVDRGFLSLAEAQGLLDNYRSKAVQHFPFVPISSETTVSYLRSAKPFLFMCVMATMKFDNCSIQHQIGEEIRNQAHQRVLMQSESTLEILQGLLIYLAWYQYFFISYEKQQIVPIAQLCVSLVQNLGLDQNPDNMRRKVDLGPDETAPGRKAARSAEQLRALLGTYCTASWVSIKFRTRGALPYTGYIKQSWELLLANAEYPSDLMIPYFVRINELCRRICDTFGYDDLENSGMRGEFVSAMALQTLNNESALLKASIPLDLHNNLAIKMEVYLLDTLLGEVSLHDDFWDSTSTSNVFITNNPSSSTNTRVSILFNLIRSCKSLNEAIIAYQDEELWYISFYTTAKICRSLLCLSNASKISSEIFRETGLASYNAPFMAISSPVHDAMTVERVADLKGEAKRLQVKFKNLSSQVQKIGNEEDIMLGFSDMIWAVAAAYEKTKWLEPGLLGFSIGSDGQNSSSELDSSAGYLSSTGSGNMQPEAVLDFGLMEDETWEELLAGIATVNNPPSSLQVLAAVITKQIADVGIPESVDALAQKMGEAFGYVAVVINNAAFMKMTLTANVYGPYLIARALAPLLVKSQLKTIINISSVGAHLLSPTLSSYQISKLALIRLTEFISVEYADKGTVSYSVHPGNSPSEMLGGIEGIPEQFRAAFVDTPALCANSLVYLASERRPWLAGRYINLTWDLPELMTKEEEIVKGDKLKVRLVT